MKNIKLLQVTGYYQEGNNFDFVEEKSWTGKAILREDLTFERIVVDKADEEELDRLISGTLVDYNGASLMKFTNNGFCPCSFFGMSNGKEVIGSWAVHNFFSARDVGRCKIIFAEIPIEEAEVDEISEKIESFKAEMDSFSSELYESLIENMTVTVTEFIQNMKENKDNIEEEVGFELKKLEI